MGTDRSSGEHEPSRRDQGIQDQVTYVVYHLFDSRDRSLYIGVTHDQSGRFRTHRREKWWWGNVARIETTEYQTLAEAAAAEQAAIREHMPVHNRAGITAPTIRYRPRGPQSLKPRTPLPANYDSLSLEEKLSRR